ncbi:hypothetical protein PVAP13_6NG263200 [Panicum virgatum]|uniref:F-box domain-containing protein n=1 Tax=Panicum virgatum TaxID=38727 RepID=A0A8T0R1V9_PANVG|nr:hypothetical protein PVAP13_6NG263200 [Panicum virgatum]
MAAAAPADRDEATAAVVGEGWNLPTDVFVEILLLIPADRRWRLRIVCRHWRDVIHERTPAPERWSQPLALVFVQDKRSRKREEAGGRRRVRTGAQQRGRSGPGRRLRPPRVQAGGRRRGELWSSETVPAVRHRHPRRRWEGVDAFDDTMMVGTCNGLLCLCDNTRPGGAISVLNPATGEAVALPPLPGSAQWVWWGMQLSGWHEAYTFAYQPMTEQYKVVHLPCYLDRSGGFNAVQVFALGKAAARRWWRDAPTPGASCCLDARVVAVDGVAYWLTKGAERVVAFDVREERVTSTRALPAAALQLAPGGGARAAGPRLLQRRLGPRRRRRGSAGVRLNDGLRHLTAWPHLAHGDYILTEKEDQVFEHRLGSTGRWCGGEVLSVRIGEETPGVAVPGPGEFRRRRDCVCGVFAYIKTKEPLSVHN